LEFKKITEALTIFYWVARHFVFFYFIEKLKVVVNKIENSGMSNVKFFKK